MSPRSPAKRATMSSPLDEENKTQDDLAIGKEYKCIMRAVDSRAASWYGKDLMAPQIRCSAHKFVIVLLLFCLKTSLTQKSPTIFVLTGLRTWFIDPNYAPRVYTYSETTFNVTFSIKIRHVYQKTCHRIFEQPTPTVTIALGEQSGHKRRDNANSTPGPCPAGIRYPGTPRFTSSCSAFVSRGIPREVTKPPCHSRGRIFRDLAPTWLDGVVGVASAHRGTPRSGIQPRWD